MTGIFQGKEALYNRLVLKSLISGPQTATQIALYIYQNRGNIPPEKINQNDVKQIRGQITRRKQGGRLPHLEKKHYIRRDNTHWDLTDKGTYVALTLFDNIQGILPPSKGLTQLMRGKMDSIAADPDIKRLLKRFRLVFGEDFTARWKGFLGTDEFIKLGRTFTQELIDEGVNLDRLSDDEFSTILSGKLASYYATMLMGKNHK